MRRLPIRDGIEIQIPTYIVPIRGASKLPIQEPPPEVIAHRIRSDRPLHGISYLSGHELMQILNRERGYQATMTPAHDHRASHLDPLPTNSGHCISHG